VTRRAAERDYPSTVRFRVVLFDVGETLVHPAPSFPELFSAVLAGEGHVRAPGDVVEAAEVVLSRFSEAARDRDLWTTSPERSRRFWTGVYGRMLETLDLRTEDHLPDRLYGAFTDLANYELFADVEAAFARLRSAGITLGVVSNFEAWLEDLLGVLGVSDDLPVRAISGLEGIEKPDPRIYELALERAGVTADETAFVGDNPEFDVDPPASLGMFPVLVDRNGRHPDFEGVRVGALTELPAVLEAAG
jgi:putative hydrolase of the HAD superfamily